MVICTVRREVGYKNKTQLDFNLTLTDMAVSGYSGTNLQFLAT